MMELVPDQSSVDDLRKELNWTSLLETRDESFTVDDDVLDRVEYHGHVVRICGCQNAVRKGTSQNKQKQTSGTRQMCVHFVCCTSVLGKEQLSNEFTGMFVGTCSRSVDLREVLFERILCKFLLEQVTLVQEEDH